MIKINIICIGKIKEKYFTDAIAEYAKLDVANQIVETEQVRLRA